MAEEGLAHMIPVAAGRRLAVADVEVRLETRGRGDVWIPVRVVPMSDIRAVYRYESRDWSFLVVATAYWFGGVLLVLLTGWAARWSPALFSGGIVGVTLLVAALALYRIRFVPRPMLRIEAYSGPLLVRCPSTEAFRLLRARLPGAASAAAGSGPAPNGAAPQPPSGGSSAGSTEGAPER